MTKPGEPVNEFSRVFCLSDLAGESVTLDLDASAEECAALAARLGLVAIGALAAHLEIKPWRRDGLAVSGHFRAVLVQTCVVTLDPFEAVIQSEVAARFAPAGAAASENLGSEIRIDPLQDDEPEVLVAGCADLGELVVEHLATALDPHPRKPGSDFQSVMSELKPHDAGEDDTGAGPFAVLARLRQDDEKS